MLSSHIPDVTFTVAEVLDRYHSYMEIVRAAARLSDDSIWDYIFAAVTKDLSYVTLTEQLGMPCSRDYFYDRLRKFFYILSFLRENYASYSERRVLV